MLRDIIYLAIYMIILITFILLFFLISFISLFSLLWLHLDLLYHDMWDCNFLLCNRLTVADDLLIQQDTSLKLDLNFSFDPTEVFLKLFNNPEETCVASNIYLDRTQSVVDLVLKKLFQSLFSIDRPEEDLEVSTILAISSLIYFFLILIINFDLLNCLMGFWGFGGP